MVHISLCKILSLCLAININININLNYKWHVSLVKYCLGDINLNQYLKDIKVNPFSFAKKDELLKNFFLSPFCDASILHFLVSLSFVKQSLILPVATSDDRSGFTNKKISTASGATEIYFHDAA